MKEKKYLSKETLKELFNDYRGKISRIEFIVDSNMDLPGVDVNSLLYGHILMYFDLNDDYSDEQISWTIHIVSSDKIYLKGDWSFGFSDLKKLISIDGLENLDTSEVTNMMGLFYNCQNLKSVDLSTWDTSNVKCIAFMFDGCTSLEEFHVPLNSVFNEVYKNSNILYKLKEDIIYESKENINLQDIIKTDGKEDSLKRKRGKITLNEK